MAATPTANPDIFLQIIQYCDFSTFLRLRLLERFTQNLIHTYESSICNDLAKNLWPKDYIRIKKERTSYLRGLPLLNRLNRKETTWDLMRCVRSRATSIVDDDAFSNVPPGWPKESMDHGFYILWRLADISEYGTASLLTSKSVRKLSNPSKAKDIVGHEDAIKQLRLEFLTSLPPWCCFDYRIALYYMSATFFLPFFGVRAPGPGNIEALFHGNSWCSFYIMRAGPKFLLQWYDFYKEYGRASCALRKQFYAMMSTAKALVKDGEDEKVSAVKEVYNVAHGRAFKTVPLGCLRRFDDLNERFRVNNLVWEP